MEGFPKDVRLKDGNTVTLRPLESGDLERLHAFFCALPVEDRLYLKDDVTDRAVITRWVGGADVERVLTVVALQGGRIVGDATLLVERYGWSRHVGEIRVVVARDLQSRGLGTALAREVVQHAMGRELAKLKVLAMDTQATAIHAFERLGFNREAVLPGHVVDQDGQIHDLVVLTTDTASAWNELEDALLEMDVVFRT